jgi:hypothetical protein
MRAVGGRLAVFSSGMPVWLISLVDQELFVVRMLVIGVAGWRAAGLELDRGHPPVPAGRWLYRVACWFRASARVGGGSRDR